MTYKEFKAALDRPWEWNADVLRFNRKHPWIGYTLQRATMKVARYLEPADRTQIAVEEMEKRVAQQGLADDQDVRRALKEMRYAANPRVKPLIGIFADQANWHIEKIEAIGVTDGRYAIDIAGCHVVVWGDGNRWFWSVWPGEADGREVRKVPSNDGAASSRATAQEQAFDALAYLAATAGTPEAEAERQRVIAERAEIMRRFNRVKR